MTYKKGKYSRSDSEYQANFKKPSWTIHAQETVWQRRYMRLRRMFSQDGNRLSLNCDSEDLIEFTIGGESGVAERCTPWFRANPEDQIQPAKDAFVFTMGTTKIVIGGSQYFYFVTKIGLTSKYSGIHMGD